MVEVPSRGYQPIENYGVIGDLYTVALVGMDGSIDFFAFPHFDSPTVFAALLDHVKGGRFQIAPQLANARQKQLYLPDSNILLGRSLGKPRRRQHQTMSRAASRIPRISGVTGLGARPTRAAGGRWSTVRH